MLLYFYFYNFNFYSLALQAPVSTVVTVARAFATTSSVAILQMVCCVSVTSSLLTLASIVAKNCNVSQINPYLLMNSASKKVRKILSII